MKHLFTRGISLLLAMGFLLSMAACASQQTQDPTEFGTDAGAAAPSEEYTLPMEEGCNQLTFYWAYPEEVDNADIWIWFPDQAGKGYVLHPCEYGYKTVVNVPEGITEVGFIVRRDCSDPGGSDWGSATKDVDSDRFAIIEGKETVVYLKTGDPMQYSSDDGGKTVKPLKKFGMAAMIDFTTLSYTITPSTKLTAVSQVKVYQDGKELAVQGLSSLNKDVASGTITMAEKLDITKVYQVEIEGFGRQTVLPTKIFDSEEFIDNYTYDGDDLGAVIHGSDTTFKVWAPTASKVVLNLYSDGHTESLIRSVDMVLGEKGVWSHTQLDCGHGTYYTYTVTTAVGTQDATDPYAKAAGVNGDRSMVVDLSKTDPEGWGKEFSTGIKSYSEATIWEVHVRDFSNQLTSSKYPGKYLAFTERGLTNASGLAAGVDYLVNLGVSHVHLLPVYDFATIDETKLDTPQFNWGYDPKNYNVPEGSYSTDPYNGEVRINEYKQMVMGLHEAGLGVIMDVVYNHTYDGNSAFNRIVPYYYYRYTSSGANSSASGCGNDTASERYMFRKFMVDSVSYWAEEYDLDGFRFDLMGLHDLETMRQIEEAVHAINPEAIIYGEGWTMGATGDGSPQANQSNISAIKPSEGAIGSVAVFNDAIRDGLKGSVFDKLSQGYISGAHKANLSKVQFGIDGGAGMGAGWIVENSAVINYMSAHDNHTLWDKLALSNPDNDLEERMAMNRLGAAILMVSKGTPFWQAGEEMLRTKDGDENSYKSGDEINNIKWDVLTEGSNEYAMMKYYQGLIAMRKAYPILGAQQDVTITFEKFAGDCMAVKYEAADGSKALVLINPVAQALPYTLEGEWNLVADGTRAGSQVLAAETGSVTVEGRSVRVYIAK